MSETEDSSAPSTTAVETTEETKTVDVEIKSDVTESQPEKKPRTHTY